MKSILQNMKDSSLSAILSALIAQFESVKRSAEELLKQEIRVANGLFIFQRVLGVIKSYGDARRNFYSIMLRLIEREITVPLFTEKDAQERPLEVLQKIINICEFIIEFLKQHSRELTKEERDRIDSLRKELDKVKNFNLSLYLHLNEALSEYEHRHYLSTVLLSGKVIYFVLEQIPGKDDSEKISKLIRERIVPEDLGPELLNGARSARNYYIHEINTITRL